MAPEAIGVIALLSIIALSWIFDFFWEKYTSKKGATEALKESGISQELQQQKSQIQSINDQNKSVIKELGGLKSELQNVSNLSKNISEQNNSIASDVKQIDKKLPNERTKNIG